MLFPADAPGQPTGPGALIWPAAAGCPGGAGARVQAILPGQPPAAPSAAAAPDVPDVPDVPDGPDVAGGSLLAAASPLGRIAIAGADPHRRGSLLVVQGRADGRFRALLRGGIPAGAAMSTAYLGDLALLTRLGGGGLGLRVERWFGDGLQAQRRIATSGRGAPASLAVAMDFRSDAIAAWAKDGSIWVSDAPQRGAARRPVRLGPAGADPHIAALLSDDNRGMVMWSETARGTTRVWLDFSSPGPHFGRPRLLESFTDPPGTSPAGGSPLLVRLSGEGVMTAWAGAADGRWVVHTAPIEQRGVGTIGTIGAPDADMLLYALAPGPRGEAVALLGERSAWPSADAAELPGRPGSWSAATVELLAARGTVSPGRTSFSPPEAIGAAQSVSAASVAVEPASDRALAAWVDGGGLLYWSASSA